MRGCEENFPDFLFNCVTVLGLGATLWLPAQQSPEGAVRPMLLKVEATCHKDVQ